MKKKLGGERGGIKGSRKGIKYGVAGRNIHETEHQERMHYKMGEHKAFPAQDPDSVDEESTYDGEG